MAFCSVLQNRRFFPTLESAILSHFRNQRFSPVYEIGRFASFKIDCFVLIPNTSDQPDSETESHSIQPHETHQELVEQEENKNRTTRFRKRPTREKTIGKKGEKGRLKVLVLQNLPLKLVHFFTQCLPIELA